MFQVADEQDTFFKEEIQPGEALGGASGSVSRSCVQGKLPAMIQGEVWKLIWVNRRRDPDFAAQLSERGKAAPCRAAPAAGRKGRQEITLG